MFPKSFAKWGWPLFMAFIRLPLILLGNGVIILLFRSAGQPAGMTVGAIFSTLSVTVVNVVCLGLLLWRARVEGFQLGAIAGFPTFPAAPRPRMGRFVVNGAVCAADGWHVCDVIRHSENDRAFFRDKYIWAMRISPPLNYPNG